MLSVSSQGSKKGRGNRRGGSKTKDLNLGQTLGDGECLTDDSVDPNESKFWLKNVFFFQGKLQIKWPGLNADIIKSAKSTLPGIAKMEIVGVDEDREKKLTEIRDKMDKFKKISVPPHERGFTSSSLNGKSLGAPLSYDDGNLNP